MQLSLIPFLLAAELGFVLLLAWRAGRKGAIKPGPIFGLLLWFTAYGVLASVLGARGFFLEEWLILWMPTLLAFPFLVGLLPVLLFKDLRAAMRGIVDATPMHWFATFHALRIAAIGTAYKTWIGEFPASFEFVVGVPDFLFGLSALWIAAQARRGRLSERGFLIWNLIGILVIVPGAPIVLQLGLPGPLQLFTSLPDARAAFTYPMSNAPMFGVPLFLLVNLWVAWRLWERRQRP